MGYRIPERDLDPPERRLTADDIDQICVEANHLDDLIGGAEMLAGKGGVGNWLYEARLRFLECSEALEQAAEIARQDLEGE